METSAQSLAGSDAVRGEPDNVTVHAGFPNPAADRHGSPLSLDRMLIKHPLSTYFFHVRGHNWEDRGIFDGDVAVIDRALTPHETDLVVWWDETGEFYLTHFKRANHQNIWGVIAAIVHPARKEKNA